MKKKIKDKNIQIIKNFDLNFKNTFHKFHLSQIHLYKKICNNLIFNGKRFLAYKVFFQTLYLLKNTFINNSIYQIIEKVIQRLRIPLEVRPWIKSGIRYKIPSKISFNRINLLAVKLLVKTAKERSEYSFAVRLANEIIETYLNNSNSIKKREELVLECLNCRPFLSLKRFGRKRKKKIKKLH